MSKPQKLTLKQALEQYEEWLSEQPVESPLEQKVVVFDKLVFAFAIQERRRLPNGDLSHAVKTVIRVVMPSEPTRSSA